MGPACGPPHPGAQESRPLFTLTSPERSAGAEEAPGHPPTRDPSQFTPNETRVAGFTVLWLRTSRGVLLEAYNLKSRFQIWLSGLQGPASPCPPPRSWDGLHTPHTRRGLCPSSATSRPRRTPSVNLTALAAGSAAPFNTHRMPTPPEASSWPLTARGSSSLPAWARLSTSPGTSS